MERARRIDTFWPWLPAFRAVAETEHLPSASEAFHITPSALSRTIRLLEEELGQPLFERSGRRIRLKASGRILLRAVRDAMRRVDEGLEEAATAKDGGVIRISVPGPFTPLLVLPALDALAEITPQLLAHPGAVAVNQGLLKGNIDLALLDDPEPSPDLYIEPLMGLSHDVFAAPDTPFGQQPLASLPFAAPLEVEGRRPDAWPVERRRRVTLEVTMMQMAIDAVRAGTHVAVLPARIAEAQGLVGLGVEGIPSTTLYMVHRPSLPGVSGRTERTAEAIRSAAATIE